MALGVAVAGLVGASLVGPAGPRRAGMARRGGRAMEAALRYVPQAAGMAAGSPRTTGPARAPEGGPSDGRSRAAWDSPIAEAWPGRSTWTPAAEADYGRFVAAIGQGFASRRCHRLDGCLLDATVNPLAAPGDRRLGLRPDCADLAYTLRAYFAFKRDLPFGWVRTMRGGGGDPRYLLRGAPAAWSQWTRFATPRAVLTAVPSHVHSGMFRLSAEDESGDTYAARIDRAGVRPGTNFYDTDGHVLVVYAVDASGEVHFIDGHPDGSITRKRLDATFIAGSARWGGGFRNWRPQRVADGVVIRARNHELCDHDPRTQYDRAAYVVDGVPARYDAWVRDRLALR